MEDIIKKEIIYSGVETKSFGTSTKYAIKDEAGKKYSFFDKKQTGEETKAYQQFKDLKIGDRIGVAVKESQGVFNGKAVTYRNAVWFYEVGPMGRDNTPQTNSTLPTFQADPKLEARLRQAEIDIQALAEVVGYDKFDEQRALMTAARDTYDNSTKPVAEEEVKVEDIPF